MANYSGDTSNDGTTPVDLTATDVSTPVDTAPSSDGGATVLESLLNFGSSIGSQLIAQDNLQNQQKYALQTQTLRAQTSYSTTMMIVVVLVIGLIFWSLVKAA